MLGSIRSTTVLLAVAGLVVLPTPPALGSHEEITIEIVPTAEFSGREKTATVTVMLSCPEGAEDVTTSFGLGLRQTSGRGRTTVGGAIAHFGCTGEAEAVRVVVRPSVGRFHGGRATVTLDFGSACSEVPTYCDIAPRTIKLRGRG